MKDVGGLAGTRSLGRTAGRTDEGHFYSPPPPTSGDKTELLFSFFSIGRKKTLCLSAVIQVAAALGAAWAPNFIVYVILEFIIGAACHGVFMCCCVLGESQFNPVFMPQTSKKLRGHTGLIMSVCQSVRLSVTLFCGHDILRTV